MKHIPVFYIYIYIVTNNEFSSMGHRVEFSEKRFSKQPQEKKNQIVLISKLSNEKKNLHTKNKLTLTKTKVLKGFLESKNKIIFSVCSFSDVIRQGKLGTLWKTLCLHIIRL